MNTVHQYAYETVEDIREEIVEERAVAASPVRMILATVAAAMLLFMTMAGLIYIKYSVAAKQIQINDLEKAIEVSRGEALRLEAKIQAQSNVMTIMEKAEELGMGYPEADSVVLVSLDDVAEQDMSQITMKGEN